MFEERWGYIDQDGVILLDFNFLWASCFSEGLAAVCKDWRWGYISIHSIEDTGDQEERKTIFGLERKKKKPRVFYFDHMPMGDYKPYIENPNDFFSESDYKPYIKPYIENPYVFFPGESKR